MPVDSQTLRDLDVLSNPLRGGPTLLSLVDHTKFRAGHEALRQRLIAPADSAAAILALQDAHRGLAADGVSYRALLDRTNTDAATKYLNSNWSLPSSSAALLSVAERLLQPRWFRDYLHEVHAGRFLICSLLGTSRDLCRKLEQTPSEILRAVGGKLATLLADPTAASLLELTTRRAVSSQLAFDELARGTAKPVLLEIIAHFGTLEAMWSLGVSAETQGWCYPTPAERLCATGLVHPFLGAVAVDNDVDLDPRARVCFVTGPNMAGKSTFLKAIAAAFLLAHAGCAVPAASMEFPVVRTVFSSVQIADSLRLGESFYLAEVRRIRSLASALHEHDSAFAVLDEPFRGTNVHDAAEATLAVVSRLAERRGALVFVASHLADIVPFIAENDRICLLHFSADVSAGRPVFDYRLRPGISTQRLGMTLLKQEGVLDLLELPAESPARPRRAAPDPPA